MQTIDPNAAYERGYYIEPVGIFNGIGDDDFQALLQAGEWLDAAGELFIQDGFEQNYLYVVATGKVEVFKYNAETGKRHVLATLNQGACLGEIAFLRGDVASANVKALKNTVLWRIDHSCMQQYISEYPGGGQLCLNLADTLAQRVQEGNTRLIGVSQSLSAYFGHVAREQNSQASIEAPQAAGMADMEIPRSIHDMFVRETLELGESTSVGNDQRQSVDQMIQNNDIDFISWLEAGQQSHRLKVILKFQLLDAYGNPIDDAAQSAQGVVDEGVDKEALRSAYTHAGPDLTQGHMIRVPQIQARVKAHTAVIKEKPDYLWRAIHIGAYVLLPIVTMLTVLKFLPFEARTSISESSTFQSIPLSSLVEKVMFAPSEFHNSFYLSKGEQLQAKFSSPAKGLFDFALYTASPTEAKGVMRLKITQAKGEVIVDERIAFESGVKKIQLHHGVLSVGDHRMEVYVEEWKGKTLEATFSVEGKH